MKRNLKITISALAVMLVMALAVTVISFSLAGNEKKGSITDEAVSIAGSVDSNTNIDNIIENSFRTDDEDLAIYKVVEIGSGAPSTLKDMVESGDFVNYVINGNKTIEFVDVPNASSTDASATKPIEAIMAADKISYEFFSASAVTDENTEALAKISNADFIYVSNDAASPYSTDNDICEELYNLLHTYAVGDYKPLVIDDIGDSAGTGAGGGTGGGTTGSKYSMSSVATNVFEKSGKYYYTFKWTDGQDVADFFNHIAPSAYLGINGNKKSVNWTEVAPKVEGATPSDSKDKKKMAEILVVNNGATPMANAIMSEETYGKPLTNLVDMSGAAVTGDVYNIADTLLYREAYNGRYVRPDLARVTKVALADVAAIQLDKYDLVIIEADCNVDVDEAIYKKFAAAMYGSVQMIYSSKMCTGNSGNTGNTESGNTSSGNTVYNQTNYSEIFYMVATTDSMPKYVNIMVTNKTEFDFISTSKSSATCKVIADLINASAFRGIGGPAGAGNMYTVLEIQPCYPIDEELAIEVGKTEKRIISAYTTLFGPGNYYTKPSDVVNGKTKEQIPEGTQYYAWELSKAKIAEVTGLSVNQINLVQMSSEELACSKTDILGTYDLVYVGANYTALKDLGQYRSVINMTNAGGTIGASVTEQNIKKLPIYVTYSHSGDLVRTTVVTQGSAVNGSKSAARAKVNGAYVDSFAVLNGNDITYNNLQALNDYVDAGMPIVFNTAATDAYNDAKTNGLLQNSLDPDSNMFKFMDACKAKSEGSDEIPAAKNILWNFDNTKEVRTDNNGGTLGETQVGYVKVFAGSLDDASTTSVVETNGITTDIIDDSVVTGDRAKLAKLLSDSNIRPKLTVTASPAIYNMYDESTKLSDRNLKFEYKVNSSSNYSVNLYIDDDGNSKFDTKERVASGNANDLSYGLASSFFGPLYWKLEVVDDLGMETSVTGISYIKSANREKQDVRVLQIMPSGPLVETDDPARDTNTLFFCTICQQTYHRLEYNPISNSGDRAGYNALYSGNYFDTDNGVSGDVYLGKHEHRFGIVQYDSTLELPADVDSRILAYGNTGMDDWDTNLADEVSDLYDFDIDIMNRKEFEATADAVRAEYNFKDMTDAQKDAIINSFAIQATDKEEYVEKYNALAESEDKDAKLKLIRIIENSRQASYYYGLYEAQVNSITPDYEKALVEKLQLIKKNYANPIQPSGVSKFGDKWSKEYFDKEIDRIIELKAYWDFFSICNFEAVSNDVTPSYLYTVNADGTITHESIRPTYSDYVKSKDKEIEYLEQYKHYKRLENPDNWLLGCYQAVIIGPSDDFGGDDITNANALADLSDYIDNDGTLLLFHDTLSKFTDAGSVVLTSTLRDDFGMDRYHMTLDETKAKSQKVTVNTVRKDNFELLVNGSWNANLAVTPTTGKVEATIVNQGWGMVKSDVKTSGELKGEGLITVELTITNPDGTAYADKDVSINVANTDQGVTGKTDANGKVTLLMPNYTSTVSDVTVADYYYMPYVSTDPNKYFMSNLSFRTDDIKYASWATDMTGIYSGFSKGKYLSNVAFTDAVAISDDDNNHLSIPYRYAEMQWSTFVNWNRDATFTEKSQTKFGTNRASQNNKGIITLFPFTLSDELNIAGTHSQVYALDVESDDMTVWYSLAAGTNTKDGSSIYAASPRDGMDNYFIYSYGSVYYCGAGHSKVTGIGKDNNDERRLYINIICNSVRKSAMQPDIFVYDYQTTLNEKIKKLGELYTTKVDKTDDYPEFSFLVRLDEEAELKRVRIYYDLDYLTNETDAYPEEPLTDEAKANHPLIANWTSAQVTEGFVKDVFRYDGTLEKLLYEDTDGTLKQIQETYVNEDGETVNTAATMLKLQPSYFEPYNGQYTYIVIEVTDDKGNISYKRIKIQLKDKLFNLT